MTPEGLHQIKIQIAAIIGPGTEALTDAGRLAIFDRHEDELLKIAGLFQETTQRDRRIREFLENPLVQELDPKEMPKVVRFALEYKRIKDHTGGDFSSGYNKTLFGEDHANYQATQKLVEAYNPRVVYHEFYEEPETIAWAKEKGYILKPFDLSYKDKAKFLDAAAMHAARERFMKKQLEAADPSVKNAFVSGSDHIFSKQSLLYKEDYRKVDPLGKVTEKKNDLLSTYQSHLTGEADASAKSLVEVKY